MSPLRRGCLVRPGAPANPRRAAPVIAQRVRFCVNRMWVVPRKRRLSSQCGTEAFFFLNREQMWVHRRRRDEGKSVSEGDTATVHSPQAGEALRKDLISPLCGQLPQRGSQNGRR